jgi:hypothetical protein
MWGEAVSESAGGRGTFGGTEESLVAFSADAKVGIGGGPTRATTLPTDAAERKQYPIATGFLDYFPDAIAAVAHLSWKGNEQHNPGQPVHWARGKSADQDDTLARHFLQRGTLDTDGVRHTTKLAWRALALLQQEIEAERAAADVVAVKDERPYGDRTDSWGAIRGCQCTGCRQLRRGEGY